MAGSSQQEYQMGQMGVRRMLRNNNQAAVNRIYHRMLKQNKVRNVIVILAIVLITFMFTAVFILGFSIAKNLNQMQLRLQGTRSSISVSYTHLTLPTIAYV